MFKDTVIYTDYNGISREEDLYFNLNDAEIIILDNKTPGGLHNKLEAIAKTMDNVQIMDYFMMLVSESYGVKSDDGKRFVKSPELFEEFKQTEAFNVFFMKLLQEDGFADRFIAGILPNVSEADMKKAKEQMLLKQTSLSEAE